MKQRRAEKRREEKRQTIWRRSPRLPARPTAEEGPQRKRKEIRDNAELEKKKKKKKKKKKRIATATATAAVSVDGVVNNPAITHTGINQPYYNSSNNNCRQRNKQIIIQQQQQHPAVAVNVTTAAYVSAECCFS